MAGRVEHRALLDVRLEVGDRAGRQAGAGRGVGVAGESRAADASVAPSASVIAASVAAPMPSSARLPK